ncbi:MAG TPA: CAP domain-containing protein [Desulfosporosinus sp.]|nr:CAP domain-containing protein [Desulfosporosinus sp.]
MKKNSRFLIGIQIGVLMTAVALPVQAAVNIGAPKFLSGSVITLRSSIPVATQVTQASTQGTKTTVSTPNTTCVQNPTPSQPIKISQSKPSVNVVSLNNASTQPTATPVTPAPSTPVTPTPSTPSTTSTAPAIPAVTALTADEQHMVDLINQERIAAGVNPVKADLRLTAVGRAKANDMKVNNYFSHTSPTYGSPWDMMQQVGLTYRWAGENISGNKSVEASMAALMQSPGHKANILDPRCTHVGVGIANGSVYGSLYVQEFMQQ